MTDKTEVYIFGEVLFDCFPSGERVLGGAPFNVAWHLQALGNRPRLISRVGYDALGDDILKAMTSWGMDAAMVQIDAKHRTGQVEIKIIDGEPHYNITPKVAYDFIAPSGIDALPPGSIFYHGSLGLRHAVSRDAFQQLTQSPGISLFLDVNLRPPWWKKDEIFELMTKARWVKLNEDEFRQLGFDGSDLKTEMEKAVSRFQLEHLIVTRGADGALVLTDAGDLHHITPEPVESVVDTVGAGDAFTAVYIHGLVSGWPVADTLVHAQRFASKVIGLRGAISTDSAFYQDFID